MEANNIIIQGMSIVISCISMLTKLQLRFEDLDSFGVYTVHTCAKCPAAAELQSEGDHLEENGEDAVGGHAHPRRGVLHRPAPSEP